MYLLKQSKKKQAFLLLLILFSLPAILPLFHPGFFQSDDGEWMIIRFSAFHEAFRDGQIPVRWLMRLNYGYGYPVANFLYPGFMYLGEVFKLVGFGFVETIKIIFGFSMVGSAVFTYLWLSKLFNKWSSFVGSLLYLYAPYYLFDVYKRGSVGEALALCLAPFVFWQIERKSFFWTSIGVAFLILSHNTLAFLFLPLTIAYLISRGLPFAIYFLPSIVLGLGLSSFFWIPAIFDLQYTVFGKIQVGEWQNHFVSLNLIGPVFFIIFVWFLIRFDYSNNRTKIFMFFIGVLSVFLSLSASSFIWKWLPVAIVQFPFRFLSVVILSTSFLVAVLVNRFEKKKAFVLGILLLIVGFFSAFPYLKPEVVFDKGDAYYATNEDTTTVKGEYMPLWVKSPPKEHVRQRVEVTSGKVYDLLERSNRISFSTSSDKDIVVTVNTIYFPGWKATVDGKNSAIAYKNNKGVIQLAVSKGAHKIRATFSETPVRLLSDFLSLLSIVIILVLSKKSMRV